MSARPVSRGYTRTDEPDAMNSHRSRKYDVVPKRIALIRERLSGIGDRTIRPHGLEDFDGPGLMWVWMGNRCYQLPIPVAKVVMHAKGDLEFLLAQLEGDEDE